MNAAGGTTRPEWVTDEFRRKHKTDVGAVPIFDLPVMFGHRLWTCSMCAKRDIWRDGWRTYGSLILTDLGWTVPICSDECQEAYEIMRKGP